MGLRRRPGWIQRVMPVAYSKDLCRPSYQRTRTVVQIVLGTASRCRSEGWRALLHRGGSRPGCPDCRGHWWEVTNGSRGEVLTRQALRGGVAGCPYSATAAMITCLWSSGPRSGSW